MQGYAIEIKEAKDCIKESYGEIVDQLVIVNKTNPVQDGLETGIKKS